MMAEIEIFLLWCTLFSYVIVFCAHLVARIYEKPRLLSGSFLLLRIAFIAHTCTGVAHMIASGHLPVTNTYELNLTGSWFSMFLFFLFERLKKIDRVYALVIVPITFLVIGHGYINGIQIGKMGAAFDSLWLVVHVLFAWIAFGSYALSMAAAFFYLLKNNYPNNKQLEKLPPLKNLDLSIYHFIVLGFINHAIMIVSGSIWAKSLWGHYWMWDPLETWSLISFLWYALYLHVRSFLGWKMTKSAWLSIAGLFILVISYWGVGFFSPTGMHIGP